MNSLTSWQLAHAAGLAELAAPDRSSRAAPYDLHRPTRLDAPAWRSGPAFGALLADGGQRRQCVGHLVEVRAVDGHQGVPPAPVAICCWAIHAITSDFRQTRRRPNLNDAGPAPMLAQYRQVLALVPVNFSRSVELTKSLSTLN